MKRYTLSFAAAITHTPKHPERTASKSGTGANFDVTFQVWPNRTSMVRSIRMQEHSVPRLDHWRAYQPLTVTEGY